MGIEDADRLAGARQDVRLAQTLLYERQCGLRRIAEYFEDMIDGDLFGHCFSLPCFGLKTVQRFARKAGVQNRWKLPDAMAAQSPVGSGDGRRVRVRQHLHWLEWHAGWCARVG
ncbi:hypothetical protein D3C78_1404020 [compost metagenome]